MGNQEIVDRTKILSGDSMDYGFDKILRGYDPKQVNEYITNLTNTNKQASMLFDQRLADARNETEMLKYELEQTKASLTQINDLFAKVSAQRDELKEQIDSGAVTAQADNASLDELNQKLDSALTQNRLLRDENRKLEENNTNLQRDVAHLSKKADKNRFEIKNLREQLENGIDDKSQQQNAELAKIYEDALEKAEDLIFRMQTEFSLARSKAEDTKQ